MVCFNFVPAKNSQKNWFDIVLWPNCFVRGSLIGILFCVIHCTPEVYIYCSKLSGAHQGDRFTSCENIISCSQTMLLSPASPGIDPVRVDDNVMCNLREVVPLKNRLFVTDTVNLRQPLSTFTCNPGPPS